MIGGRRRDFHRPSIERATAALADAGADDRVPSNGWTLVHEIAGRTT
jgi:hypothetical protein